MGRSPWAIRVLPAALIASTVLTPATKASAASITVSSFADELNGSPPCSLREALQSANTDTAVGGCAAGSGADEIVLQEGTYSLSLGPIGDDANTGGDLDVTAGTVAIRGAGASLTIIDAGGIDRVMHVASLGAPATANLSDLTIRNGGTTAAVGFMNTATGTLTLTRAVLRDNDAGLDGPGAMRNEGTATLVDVSVLDNRAGDATGGIFNLGTLTMANSTLSGNIANIGGGLENQGMATLVNVTVSGNSASGNGGGIANTSGGTVDLNNATITGNTADSDGDGGEGGGISNAGTVNMKNSIVAGNTDGSPGSETPDCQALTSQGHNLIGNDKGCTLTLAAGDQVGTSASPIDPHLGPLADNGGPTLTRALLSGSPAIDAGGADCAPTDQRGAPRSCDIGAYERVLCMKGVVNKVGTEGSDVSKGTSGSDVFLALGGRDRLTGGAGADRLCGGAGKDILKGGGGKDRLNGQGGKDTCVGGPGRDRARSCERAKSLP